VLVALWMSRLFVTLFVMLAYERQYDFLDSYSYFTESVDIALNGYSPDAAFGTRNVEYAFATLWGLLPPSFHALKVSCAYVGLGAVFLFWKTWRTATGSVSLWPLWIVGLAPSILFWSSTLGKEPLILFGIALASWGVVTSRRGFPYQAFAAVSAGLLIILCVRPWMALVFASAFALASIVLPSTKGHRLGWLAIMAAVVAAGLLYVQDIVAIIARGNLVGALEIVSSGWAIGGSASQPLQFSSFTDVLWFWPTGAFTALFRPLPGEVAGAFGLLAGLENAVTLACVFLAAPRLLRSRWSFPLVFVVIYIVLWSGLYAFLSYQNLGTAVRFKLQVVPFLLALVGMAAVASGQRRVEPAQSQ